MTSLNRKCYYIQRDITHKLLRYPKSFFLDSIAIEFFSNENFYSKFSFLCLFLDEYPKVALLKNSLDKKKIGVVNGCRVILRNNYKKKWFIFRLKMDLYPLLSNSRLSKITNYDSFAFNLSPNSIKDFRFLYSQYYDLPEFRVTLNFALDQKKEGILNLSAWLN